MTNPSTYVFTPPPVVSVPVVGTSARYAVHRVYCVGRNYEEHAKEMGYTGREPPFFFLKPADAIVVVDAGTTGTIPYPSLTKNFHHEIELVVPAARTFWPPMPTSTFTAMQWAWT